MKLAIALHRIGLSSDLLHGLGFASVVGSLALWARSAGAGDQFAKARAERVAIFVGLWPPTLFLLGKVLQDLETVPEEQTRRAQEARDQSPADALRAA